MKSQPRSPKHHEAKDLSYVSTPGQYVDHFGSEDEPQQPHRHRLRHWRKILLVVFLVLLAAGAWYGYVIATNLSHISTQPIGLSGLDADNSGRTNILVLGIGDPGHAGQNLSDTMMVISLNTKLHRVAEISVPRDLQVQIPGYGTAKINSANALGGPQLAKQVITNTLGIPINYYVQTNFTGLEELVNAVGGITVDVKQELTDLEYPCAPNQYKVCGLDIKPGVQHMNGAVALKYVRCRKGTCGNDFGRALRQQEVIGLVRQKLVRWQLLLDPPRLAAVSKALRDSLSTDLGALPMLQLALGWQEAQKNQPIQLVFSTSPGGYLVSSRTSSNLLPADGTFAAMQDRVENIFTEPTRSTDLPTN